MSTPFFCLGFSKKRKRDTKHKTPHSATPSIDGDGTRRAVFRTRFHQCARARRRGEGVNSGVLKRVFEKKKPPPLVRARALLFFVIVSRRCVRIDTKKKRARKHNTCAIDSFAFFARCPPRKPSRSRVSSPIEESLGRPLEKGIVRASSSSLPARDDEGEKGPPPKTPTRVLKFGSVR